MVQGHSQVTRAAEAQQPSRRREQNPSLERASHMSPRWPVKLSATNQVLRQPEMPIQPRPDIIWPPSTPHVCVLTSPKPPPPFLLPPTIMQWG
jgi:hypothetical protein